MPFNYRVLKELANTAGSQVKLANLLETSPAQLTRWIKGHNTPSVDTIDCFYKTANALGRQDLDFYMLPYEKGEKIKSLTIQGDNIRLKIN